MKSGVICSRSSTCTLICIRSPDYFCLPRERNSHVAEAGYVISGSVKRRTKVDVNIRQKNYKWALKVCSSISLSTCQKNLP